MATEGFSPAAANPQTSKTTLGFGHGFIGKNALAKSARFGYAECNQGEGQARFARRLPATGAEVHRMITVQDLRFRYGKEPFLGPIDFQAEKGSVLGFLGPSGAGKSTLQKILIGMLRGYTGSVQVAGREARTADSAFYERIGVAFEFPTLYEKLTGRQNLDFFGSLYAGELLPAQALLHSADQKVAEYSKGMRTRLNFIKALLHRPDILFLDEPTSGLDPTNAQVIKQRILAERDRGATILLTTHNMQDATELCDRVAFIVDGQLRALDTPHNLIMRKAATEVAYTYLADGREQAGECPLTATATDEVLRRLIAENRLTTIHSREQTLGDVFMDITGRVLA